MKNDFTGKNSFIKEKSRSFSLQGIVPFLGLVFVIILFALLTGGRNLRLLNIQRIALQSVLLMIGSVGAAFTLSHGSLDFSLGGIMGMAVIIGGLAGMASPLLVIPATLAAAVLGELLVSSLHIALRIPSFVVSLAMMFITKGILVGITQTTSVNLNPCFAKWDTPAVYFAVLIFVLVIAYILFEYTKIGKYNRAIGSNYTAAVTSGIPVNRYKTIAFIVCGFALGIAAFLNFVRAGGVSATTGSGYEINVLIALVLGGTSITGGASVKIRGAVIGCLLLTALENGLVMLGIQPAMMGLIKGLIFLASIAVAYDKKTVRLSPDP